MPVFTHREAISLLVVGDPPHLAPVSECHATIGVPKIWNCPKVLANRFKFSSSVEIFFADRNAGSLARRLCVHPYRGMTRDPLCAASCALRSNSRASHRCSTHGPRGKTTPFNVHMHFAFVKARPISGSIILLGHHLRRHRTIQLPPHVGPETLSRNQSSILKETVLIPRLRVDGCPCFPQLFNTASLLHAFSARVPHEGTCLKLETDVFRYRCEQNEAISSKRPGRAWYVGATGGETTVHMRGNLAG